MKGERPGTHGDGLARLQPQQVEGEAADELGCSQRTIETYWSRIFAKLGIRSTDGVVAAALRFAMLDSDAAEA